ncbi:condensation domain-containing protein, partial [Streptomyces sp. NPDC093801]|uniref:condensation domain-containing protein n=1 Tax=Streptomyces sp. NPDC093801 TaxID=3155203 RepID=UPI00344DC25C
RAPMLRANITEDPDSGRWLLLLQAHHLVQDHTSLEVVLHEVQAFLDGNEDGLSAPLPFRDFVAKARLQLSREEHAQYFTDLLGDVTEPTAPFGLLDIRGNGTSAVEARLPVDHALAARLVEQARRLGVSAAALFHVAWARVVARTTGRDDVVFGTVLFGRMHAGAGADRIPGLFINTLPVRAGTAVTGVADAVHAMQRQLAELLVHEHAPLALAQQTSGVPAQLPLFTALLNYRHNEGADQAPNAGLEGTELLHIQERTNYPLTISIDDKGTGFSFTVQTATAIDPVAVCALLHTATQNLVTALEAAPETPLHRIDVLDVAERRRILGEWIDTARDVPVASLPELFEARVARDPEAIAVVAGGVELSCAELNARADRLAGLLVGRGVGAESLVGVLMERSAD